VIGWNSSIDAHYTRIIPIRIIVEGKSKTLWKTFKFVNLHGPCGDKKTLWDSIMDQPLLL
jgi:hypothetical protein